MRLTLIYPSVGKKKAGEYIKSWQMEPLAIAVLAGLTPNDIEIRFYDDRLERIPFNEPTDLVAISVETFTAKRSYEIAAEYRKQSIRVILGGYHPTLMPEEALEFADSVIIGEAENVWADVIRDAKEGNLQCMYRGRADSLNNYKVDRNIFRNKKYFDISLVETGRGCKFHCEFCSISSFFGNSYCRRATKDVVEEIKNLKKKYIFFVDDNIVSNISAAKDFFKAIIPLNIKWISQASIDIAKDSESLNLMAESGCIGLLIGFESVKDENLIQMGKLHNIGIDYDVAIGKIRDKGIVLYGAFVLGYDHDDKKNIADTVEFAKKHKLFLAAFNHLIPFPGTKLYERFILGNRLKYKKWWLDSHYHFGNVPFYPEKMSTEELENECINARRKFFGLKSILSRSLDLRANCQNWKMASTFFLINSLLRKEVSQKKGLPLGEGKEVLQ